MQNKMIAEEKCSYKNGYRMTLPTGDQAKVKTIVFSDGQISEVEFWKPTKIQVTGRATLGVISEDRPKSYLERYFAEVLPSHLSIVATKVQFDKDRKISGVTLPEEQILSFSLNKDTIHTSIKIKTPASMYLEYLGIAVVHSE